MNKNKILYKLTVEDFQNVAFKEIDRKLTPQEIGIIKHSLEKKISWYDLIANSISDSKLTPSKQR
jgi:hypothetical protein